MFLQYLWGIETFVRREIHDIHGLFLQYLWGIETQSAHPNGHTPVRFLQYLWGIETPALYWLFHPDQWFLQYLWGIETKLGIDIETRILSVFTVPMRNWNNNGALNHLQIQNLFLQYLWGIETISLPFSTRADDMVFTVPMRNWNIKFNGLNRVYIPVFTVPMRNWNACRLLGPWAYNRGFYSTYEELKLWYHRSLAAGEWMFLQYLWGIETPAIVYSLDDIENVFTVPMRNWNFPVISAPSSVSYGFYSTYEELKLSTHVNIRLDDTTFLQYLWGIETCKAEMF